MMCYHLGLGQLWRCPVEWCAVWKGSVRECRDHFNDKHSGSATLDFEEVSKSFPAWTVTRDFWVQALKPEYSFIPRVGKTISAQIPGVSGPDTTPGTP